MKCFGWPGHTTRQLQHATMLTLGIDFLSKTMYLEDRTVRLQLWDTGALSWD